jgi:hypothetical protein
MKQVSELMRPMTFESGREYLLVERQGKGNQPTMTRVRFAAYDPCPAFVIVRTEVGKKWRCPRDAIYLGNQSHY